MPFTQSGSEATANIGTYNDVAGSQNNYHSGGGKITANNVSGSQTNNEVSGKQTNNYVTGNQTNNKVAGKQSNVNTGNITSAVFFLPFLVIHEFIYFLSRGRGR